MTGKVSIRQLQILIFLDIFGTGIIALPRFAAEYGSNDGWLLIVGATGFALGYTLLINSLAEMFPGESFHQYSGKIVGRPLGTALSLLLAARIIFSAGIELRVFSEMIKLTLLTKTPTIIISAVTALLGAYLIYLGYEARARLAEIMLIPIITPILLVFIAAGTGVDFTNILPMFKVAPENILYGSFFLSFSFKRLELALLVYPLAAKPEQIKKGQLKAVIVTGGIMLLTTMITIMKFGTEDVKAQMWPALRLTDTIDIPGGFFERVDALAVSLWIFSVLISTSAAIFFPSYMLEEMFGEKPRIRILLCSAAVLVVSALPKGASDAYSLLNMSDLTIGTAYLIFIPFFLFIIAKLRVKGGSEA